jgi:acetyltransferase-like isoleucine patch superfamily enzyme
MKKSIKILIEIILLFIANLLRLLYPFSFYLKIKYFKSKIFTYWHSPAFKNFGTESVLNYPIDLVGRKYISIGSKTFIGKRGSLTAWDNENGESFVPQINIGNGVSIGDNCHITAINKISIGNNVLMGKNVTITDNAHGKSELKLFTIPPNLRPLYSKGEVVIENGVWLGDKVTILAGVRIGENSIIASNAVVTKDIPANCVAGGTPAKVIKICT